VSPGALDGLLVADFSRVLAGPLCTMVLGDLGADVVKVEHPEGGDETRGWGPPFVGEDAAYFLALNRNKRSIALDLTTAGGARAALALAVRSDVLVENFRPGLMERFGLAYQEISASNPGLVYCSITTFAGGERAARPGYDLMIQALSGLMSLTGSKGGPPTKVGVALVDVVTGLDAVVGILAALRARDASGRGQRVEVSLFEASVAALVNQAANHLLGGVVPRPMGNEHPNIVPYQVFEAADRGFALAAGNDRLFARTCEVLGRPDLAQDERFATNGARVRNRDTLIPLLAGAFAARPAADWLVALERAGVPCAPVRGLDEVFASPEGREMVQVVDDPVRGGLRLTANPIRLSETPSDQRRPPPRLGEHTDEILRELGLSPGAGGDLEPS
jgi:crotonobetainyl-CoA:carnitine CoA-transferase CaiB-like acyl-CoA transferase